MNVLNHWSGRLLAALALCMAFAMPAHAKKGFAFINTGDELFEVAGFPQEIVKSFPQAATLKAGYKCSHFGIFWADIWTWDCKLVAVTGENSYADLPGEVSSRLATDPQYSFSQAKRGFWNHYAFWLLLALGLLYLGWSALSGRSQSAQGSPQQS
jgi:hypothetical protein